MSEDLSIIYPENYVFHALHPSPYAHSKRGFPEFHGTLGEEEWRYRRLGITLSAPKKDRFGSLVASMEKCSGGQTFLLWEALLLFVRRSLIFIEFFHLSKYRDASKCVDRTDFTLIMGKSSNRFFENELVQ